MVPDGMRTVVTEILLIFYFLHFLFLPPLHQVTLFWQFVLDLFLKSPAFSGIDCDP